MFSNDDARKQLQFANPKVGAHISDCYDHARPVMLKAVQFAPVCFQLDLLCYVRMTIIVDQGERNAVVKEPFSSCDVESKKGQALPLRI